MIETKKILITGAAGFIGGGVFSTLQKLGYHVMGLDNLSDYYDPSMKTAHLEAEGLAKELVVVDIQDVNTLEKMFKSFRPSIVIHLAAQGGVRAARQDPRPYIISNQLGFLNLLSLSEKFDVEHFMYASSSSVYGDRSDGPFVEDSEIFAPKSLYALSKLSNEIVSRDLPRGDMKRTGMRFFTVYGPWGRPDMAVFRLLASSILNKNFNLTADLTVLRDFTFIDDLCKSVESLMFQSHLPTNSILNIAGGNPHPLSEIFNFLESKGASVKVTRKENDPSDVKMTFGSTLKLANAGGYVPNSSLASGLDATWDWLHTINQSSLANWYDYSS